MNIELKKQISKALINSNKEELDKILASFSEEEQKEAIVGLLEQCSGIFNEQKLTNVKSRSLFYYLITSAEKRGIEEGKEVLISYVDQRKLGKINNEYGPEIGDMAISSLIDSIHKGFTGIKKSDYQIVRMGGDEFCIITTGESEEVVHEYLKKAKTIANTTELFSDGERVKEKIDFLFGTSKLDYTHTRPLRSIIDQAKKEAYYQELFSQAEEKADQSKLILLDTDKQEERKTVIKKYLANLSQVKRDGEDFRFEVINKKEENEQTKRQGSNVDIDFDFVMHIAEIASSKGFKREVLVEELYDYDIDFLKDNLFAFGQKFIREGEKPGLIKRAASDLLMEAIDEDEKTFKYIELDNLKLVNSARTHADGDVYIGNFIDMVTSSMQEAENPNETYAVKMSGNTLVLCYDKGDDKIVDDILEKADVYENPSINIPMDVFVTDMEVEADNNVSFVTSYLEASDEVKEQKERHNSHIEKIITSKSGYDIFYQRETFSPVEVNEVLDEMSGENIELYDNIMDIVFDEGEDAFVLIDEMYESGEITDYDKEVLYAKIAFGQETLNIESYIMDAQAETDSGSEL